MAGSLTTSATSALLGWLLVWLAIGALTSLVMGRRGHDPFGWLLLGAILGPLVVPLAVSAARRARVARSEPLAAGGRGGGRLDVLVGIDGSPQAAAALDAVVDLLGPRLGRLTLVAVATLDATVARKEEEARLRQELGRQASRVQARLGAAGVDVAPELVLLRGRPVDALTGHAVAGGYGLMAVGTRGAGLTHRLLGSVAESLAADTRVPVLLAGGPGSTRQAVHGDPAATATGRSHHADTATR